MRGNGADSAESLGGDLVVGVRRCVGELCLAVRPGCSGVGYWALQVAIRDAQGNPLALGATVTLYDGAYREQDSARYDPLTVYAAQERGGRRYDIQVAKRYYADAWVRGVEAPGGGCVTGREKTPVTRTVPVVLSLAPNAPAVREIHLLPPRILLDRAPYPSAGTFTPYVDANVGVSRAIRWCIAGDTGSVDFDPATGTVRYRCRARSGALTISAISAVDSSVFGTAELAVQGHPATPSDAPCS